jgi:hypothetical protein
MTNKLVEEIRNEELQMHTNPNDTISVDVTTAHIGAWDLPVRNDISTS